jgi:hypothetical protein
VINIKIPVILSPQPEGGYTVTSPLGTLRAAVRQLGISWTDFENA